MGVKLTYVGHAAWLIEGSKKVVIDPFIQGNPQAKISVSDLYDVDYIVVTHGHGDHLGDTYDIAVNSGAVVVSNYEISLYLASKGLKNLHSMHIGGRYVFPDGVGFKLTPALHGSAIVDGGNVIYGGSPAGVIVYMDGKAVYHAGDTGLTMDMKLLADEMLDVAILPIGGNYTMDVKDAVKAVSFIKPLLAIPMHYKTFPVIDADPEEFVKEVKRLGIDAKIVQPGDYVVL